jgi:hypothetical protein
MLTATSRIMFSAIFVLFMRMKNPKIKKLLRSGKKNLEIFYFISQTANNEYSPGAMVKKKSTPGHEPCACIPQPLPYIPQP